jgi:hypothetical protein
MKAAWRKMKAGEMWRKRNNGWLAWRLMALAGVVSLWQ